MRRGKAGLPPGTVVHMGKERRETVTISVIDFDADKVETKSFSAAKKAAPYKDTPTVTWINLDGIHDTDLVKQIGDVFDVHPLTLEDIVNPHQRPKVEDYGHYLFIVVRMLMYDEAAGYVVSQQVSFILGAAYVISFLESPGDVFDPVRERIRTGKGRVRTMGPDYLAYTLVDAVVDGYFAVIEKMSESVTALEGDVLSGAPDGMLECLQESRRELEDLRRAIWPMRDVASDLTRGGSKLISQPTTLYFRDVLDHTQRVADSMEAVRVSLTGLHELYLSSSNRRLAEVMKVLTVIATIFMPLSFIAGVYGMNFDRMAPPQGAPWAFFAVVGFMAGVAGAMLLYFRRRKWL